MSKESPVFVVGVFRSGTSLLCALLNQNPRIALMYECDVYNLPKPLLGRRFLGNWAARIEFYNHALSRHRMVVGPDFRNLQDIRTPQDLYRKFGAMKGADVCGEKSPFYCYRLEQLHGLYPSASFILVWRNPLEIYRSVLKAGQSSRFFGQPGMLSRMIYYQEELLRQSERIARRGARILRVDYARLVDHTEAVCREASAFLGVSFDPQMLELKRADFSPIYRQAHHDHLRRGVIERQKYPAELVSPATARKLERFRRRWEDLQAGWLNPPDTAGQARPGALELAYHQAAGKTLAVYDSLVRAGFEFLPLSWLRIYRLLKAWVINAPPGTPDDKISLLEDWRQHWRTILAATAMLGAVVWLHLHSNPHLMFILFYGVPCALVALVVSTRWATLFVIAASVISPVIQYDGDPDYRFVGVFAWNLITRFILLEIMVLTLGRIGSEFSRFEDLDHPPEPAAPVNSGQPDLK